MPVISTKYTLLRLLSSVLFVCVFHRGLLQLLTSKSTIGYYLIHELGTVLIPIEYWTGSNGASLCFQEKYMNESFDMDECCSELHHGKVSLEMDKRVCQLFNDSQIFLVLMTYCFFN